MVTRRRVLQSVGISGGAGALFATMGALGLAPDATATPAFRAPSPSDFSLTGRAAARVVILGGGIAGLAAAYELGKAGYDCTVLEARAVAGGRNLTVRGGHTETDVDGRSQHAGYSAGTYFNAGAARMAQWMVTMDYCRELGVPVEILANANADAYVHHAGAAPVRFRTAKADVYGYVSELLAKAADQGALDELVTAGDRERLMEFLTDFGDLGDNLGYAGSPRRGFASYPGAGADRGTPLPGPPPLTDVLASTVGRYFSAEFGYDQAMVMFQPVGGMDRIPQALHSAIGGRRIQLGAQVTGVTDRGAAGVEVTYRQNGWDRAVTADFCVATLPPHVLATIPGLPATVTAALSTFSPYAAAKIGLEYGRRWWERDLRIYGGITYTDLDIGAIWYPSYDFHGPRGLLVGYYNVGAQAEAYGALDPARRTERAVERGVQIHGEKYRTELTTAFSMSWDRTPHLRGAWAFPRDPAAYRLLQQPAGRIHFAGDWLSNAVAWQHGALVSARAAVTALHQRVLTS